jgi:hypothetical protein
VVDIIQKPRRQITIFAVSDNGIIVMGGANGKSLSNSVDYKHLPIYVVNIKLLSRIVRSLLFLCQFVVFHELKNKCGSNPVIVAYDG